MIPWFRFYSEVLRDRKVQLLPSYATKWRWVMILCLANEGTPRGVLPAVEAIAYELQMSRPDANALIRLLLERKLIDQDAEGTLRPHKWKERQFESDSSTERTRTFRERHTSASGNEEGTPPDLQISDVVLEVPALRPELLEEVPRTSPLTVVSPPRNGVVKALVDEFRAIPGIIASPKDGDVIAGLFGRHGEDRIRRAFSADGPAIVAADNPLMFLASRVGKQGKATGETLEQRAKRYADDLRRHPV